MEVSRRPAGFSEDYWEMPFFLIEHVERSPSRLHVDRKYALYRRFYVRHVRTATLDVFLFL